MKLTNLETILHPFFANPDRYLSGDNFTDDHDNLPDKLKDLMITGEKIKDICAKFNFDLFKGEILASVVRDVVMGYVFLGDMTAEIEKRLGVDERTAGEIGDMLLADVFAENWDELQVWNVEKYRERGATVSRQSEDSKVLGTATVRQTTGDSPANNAIATTTSYRYTPRDAIINSGYNPKAPRLTPFLTSADRQQRIIGTTAVVKPQEINKPSPAVGKIIDLRKK